MLSGHDADLVVVCYLYVNIHSIPPSKSYTPRRSLFVYFVVTYRPPSSCYNSYSSLSEVAVSQSSSIITSCLFTPAFLTTPHIFAYSSVATISSET